MSTILKRILRVCAVISPLLLVVPTSALALTLSVPNTTANGLQMSASAQYPAPGQSVTFTLTDFLDNLNTSHISWLVNGVTKDSGTGLTTFQITAGAAGTSQKVEADVIASGVSVLERDMTVTPGNVDMLYEAHSYTPPFYKGKTLYPYQGTVTVVAMPNLGRTDTHYIYTWNLGNGIDQADSGYDKNSLTLSGSVLLTPITVSVVVTTIDGTISATGKLSLLGQYPNVLVYEDNPSYGVLLNRAISNSFTLKEPEINLKAEPYNFNTIALFTTNLSYVWGINNSTIAAQNTNGDTITLRTPGSSAGSSYLSVSVTNKSTITQQAQLTSSINFNQNQ